ncbi:MAG: hypothetical protein LQ351_002883 [Letrouitia transgressa]|nr:MAG: hypothetical protein LQ351_002883 [Letrouitia transgressa]
MDNGKDLRCLSLSYTPTDPQTSALRLVLTLFPDWEHAEGAVEFIRFKDGITNTLLKAIKRRPGYTEEQIDQESVLLRAYGKGTDVLIDREKEAASHRLLAKSNLAPPLLARFQNGLIYKYIRGQVCTPEDLAREPVWRGVARRLAEWHALLPIGSAENASATAGVGGAMTLLPSLSTPRVPSQETINAITPGKIHPNVWTVMQKWILALPTTGNAETERQATLQKELERTVEDLANVPNLGNDGVRIGNVIVHPRAPDKPSGAIETVSFIDYEYATPAPAAFDLANHFSEWGGFECRYDNLPNRSTRHAFITEYLATYAQHAELPPGTDLSSYTRRLNSEVDLYRGVPGLYWGVWALIQATISQIDFDYASYAEVRLQEYWDWRGEVDGSRQRDGREIPLRERRWAQE